MRVTESLERDHELILRALDLLEGVMDRAAEGAEIPGARALSFIDFFRSFADGYHHHKEEEALFPALRDVGLVPPVMVMLGEHEQGRALLKSMEAALPALTGPIEGRAHFAALARDYADLLRAHIEKENNVLFQMASRALSPATSAAILDSFAELDRTQPEGDARAVYQRRINDLEAWMSEALKGA